MEEFLKIQTYEEYDKRRGEFKELLQTEPRAEKHMCELFPEIDNEISDGIIREVF
ncbi:MAG: hypothetical protein NC407_13515 [Lachnoclostridium sp.]|nr:hypothetical protein [Lachnoclostridium sp.]